MAIVLDYAHQRAMVVAKAHVKVVRAVVMVLVMTLAQEVAVKDVLILVEINVLLIVPLYVETIA